MRVCVCVCVCVRVFVCVFLCVPRGEAHVTSENKEDIEASGTRVRDRK